METVNQSSLDWGHIQSCLLQTRCHTLDSKSDSSSETMSTLTPSANSSSTRSPGPSLGMRFREAGLDVALSFRLIDLRIRFCRQIRTLRTPSTYCRQRLTTTRNKCHLISVLGFFLHCVSALLRRVDLIANPAAHAQDVEFRGKKGLTGNVNLFVLFSRFVLLAGWINERTRCL